MKKLIFLSFLLVSCGGEYYKIEIKEGDTRTTETSEYIIVEKCSGNAFDEPFWKIDHISRKLDLKHEKDSI